jgi:hypothetical protein
MRILRFPKSIPLELTDPERHALDRLLERQPHFADDADLLHTILAKGIVMMSLAEAVPGDGSEPTLVERMERRLKDVARNDDMETSAASLQPFARPWKPQHTPKDAQPWVACEIDPELRERIEKFKTKHDLDEEAAIAMLLEQALQAEQPSTTPTIDETFGGVQRRAATTRGRKQRAAGLRSLIGVSNSLKTRP